jgi:hypothetical protein
MISPAFVFLSLASAALAGSVVHEARGPAPAGWVNLGRHAADAVLPLRFGLAQSNLDKLEDYLLAVSHPESAEYGQWRVAAFVACHVLIAIDVMQATTGPRLRSRARSRRARTLSTSSLSG